MRRYFSTVSRLPVILRVTMAVGLFAALQFAEHALFPHHPGAVTLAAAPLLLNQIQNFGKNYEWLSNAVKPLSADQPESLSHVLFDTQSYAAAGQATLQFFQSTAANLTDPTLSNFASGILEKGQYFEIHRIFMIIHSVPVSAASVAVAGPANDIEIIHKTARGVLAWSLNGRRAQDPIPLFFFGRPGGPNPLWVQSSTAASQTIQTGNTENNGGFPVLGNQIIAEQKQFKATMSFNSTAINATTNISVAMLGVLHRVV